MEKTIIAVGVLLVLIAAVRLLDVFLRRAKRVQSVRTMVVRVEVEDVGLA